MRAKNWSFLPIYFVIFMDNFGFSMLFCILGPLLLLPDYAMISSVTSIEAKNSLLAIVYGVFPLTQFFGAPLIGDFADHFGRRKALFITIAGVTIGYFLSAFAIFIHSISLLIVSRLLSGFFAGNLSLCLAAIADLSPDEKSRARNYSNVTTIFGFSWILAMIIGGYLANPRLIGTIGPVLAFLVTGGLSVLSYVAVWWYFQETFTKNRDFKFDFWHGVRNIIQVAELKAIRWIFLAYFLWVVGWGMSIQWYPPYSIEVYQVSVNNITTWMIVLGCTWILGSSGVNRFLLRKFDSLQLATIGIIITTFLVFVAQWMSQHFFFSLLYALAGITSAFTMSNTVNLISISASADIQGKTMGLSQSVMSLGWIVSSIVAAILNREDIGAMYIFCSLMLFFSLLLIVGRFFNNQRKNVV